MITIFIKVMIEIYDRDKPSNYLLVDIKTKRKLINSKLF
jgi:hypothetical protein